MWAESCSVHGARNCLFWKAKYSHMPLHCCQGNESLYSIFSLSSFEILPALCEKVDIFNKYLKYFQKNLQGSTNQTEIWRYQEKKLWFEKKGFEGQSKGNAPISIQKSQLCALFGFLNPIFHLMFFCQFYGFFKSRGRFFYLYKVHLYFIIVLFTIN